MAWRFILTFQEVVWDNPMKELCLIIYHVIATTNNAYSTDELTNDIKYLAWDNPICLLAFIKDIWLNW